MTKGLGGKYTRGLIVQLSKVNLKYTPLSVNMMLMKLQFSFLAINLSTFFKANVGGQFWIRKLWGSILKV